MNDIHEVVLWARKQSKASHSKFLGIPSALNWRETVRDLLVYQQAEYLSRSLKIEREQALQTLHDSDQKDWPRLICEATGASKEFKQMSMEFFDRGER